MRISPFAYLRRAASRNVLVAVDKVVAIMDGKVGTGKRQLPGSLEREVVVRSPTHVAHTAQGFRPSVPDPTLLDEDWDSLELVGLGAAGNARGRERRRCQAILSHRAADGRFDLAKALAFKTQLPRGRACALLEDAADPSPINQIRPEALAKISAGTPLHPIFHLTDIMAAKRQGLPVRVRNLNRD